MIASSESSAATTSFELGSTGLTTIISFGFFGVVLRETRFFAFGFCFVALFFAVVFFLVVDFFVAI